MCSCVWLLCIGVCGDWLGVCDLLHVCVLCVGECVRVVVWMCVVVRLSVCLLLLCVGVLLDVCVVCWVGFARWMWFGLVGGDGTARIGVVGVVGGIGSIGVVCLVGVV